MPQLTVKRVYDPPAPGDGTRILVDRLWPRGVARDRIDLWLKDLAPSDDLRHAFHEHPERWEEFRAAYAVELGRPPARAALAILDARRKAGPVVLLYAAKDEDHNNAQVLRQWLDGRANPGQD